MHKKLTWTKIKGLLLHDQWQKGTLSIILKRKTAAQDLKFRGSWDNQNTKTPIYKNKFRLWLFLAHFPKVSTICLSPSPLSLLGNGMSSSTWGGFGLSVQALWLSRIMDLPSSLSDGDWKFKVKVKIMLRPTVSRPVCLRVKPHLEHKTRLLLSDSWGFIDVGAFSKERTGLSFTTVAGRRQRSHFRVLVLRVSGPYFTVWELRLPKPGSQVSWKRVAQLYPHALGSHFVASYDSQGYDGGIRTRLHMGIRRGHCFERQSTASGRTKEKTP
jgi:hypothetical protein